MTCSACSSHVEKSALKLPGMKMASVNLLTGSMQVEYDEAVCSEEMIVKAVEKGGYGAYPEEENGEPGSGKGRIQAGKEATQPGRYRKKPKRQSMR